MKKLFICMFIVFVSLFAFNLDVYAQEVDTENINLINENLEEITIDSKSNS